MRAQRFADIAFTMRLNNKSFKYMLFMCSRSLTLSRSAPVLVRFKTSVHGCAFCLVQWISHGHMCWPAMMAVGALMMRPIRGYVLMVLVKSLLVLKPAANERYDLGGSPKLWAWQTLNALVTLVANAPTDRLW